MTRGKFSAGLLVLVIRSLVFNLLFYLNLLVQIIAALPTLLMPRWGIIAVATFWARTNLWLLRVICGSKGSQALVDMNACARRELARNRRIIIFPEGTRRRPGAEPRYKYGVVSLYSAMDVPCLPIALNSGLFWPRRSMRRYPGTIRVEVLDPIPVGLGKEVFFQRLQRDVEAATARLVAEGERELIQNGTRDASLAPSP